MTYPVQFNLALNPTWISPVDAQEIIYRSIFTSVSLFTRMFFRWLVEAVVYFPCWKHKYFALINTYLVSLVELAGSLSQSNVYGLTVFVFAAACWVDQWNSFTCFQLVYWNKLTDSVFLCQIIFYSINVLSLNEQKYYL